MAALSAAAQLLQAQAVKSGTRLMPQRAAVAWRKQAARQSVLAPSPAHIFLADSRQPRAQCRSHAHSAGQPLDEDHYAAIRVRLSEMAPFQRLILHLDGMLNKHMAVPAALWPGASSTNQEGTAWMDAAGIVQSAGRAGVGVVWCAALAALLFANLSNAPGECLVMQQAMQVQTPQQCCCMPCNVIALPCCGNSSQCADCQCSRRHAAGWPCLWRPSVAEYCILHHVVGAATVPDTACHPCMLLLTLLLQATGLALSLYTCKLLICFIVIFST